MAYSDSSEDGTESGFFNKSLSCWRDGTLVHSGGDCEPIPIDLHTACSIGHMLTVKAFVKNSNEDLNRPNSGGWSPLMYAAYIGHEAIVTTLLHAGADVNCCNACCQTPLMLAASCGNEAVCDCLREAGTCELEARDEAGWTALFHAVYNGHQNVVKNLLDCGCEVNCSDRQGLTPLMQAANEGHEIIVQLLLQHGASSHAVTGSGHSARSLAIEKGFMKIVAMIDVYLGPPKSRSPQSHLPQQSLRLNDSDNYASSPESSIRRPFRGPSPITTPLQPVAVRSNGVIDRTASLARADGHSQNVGWVETVLAVSNSSRGMSAMGQKTSPLTDRLAGSFLAGSSVGRSSLTTTSPRPQAQVAKERASDEWDGVDEERLGEPRDLADLMHCLHLSKYMPLFDEQELDLKVFWTLTEADLKEVGVKLLGPRRKMTSAIARWHSGVQIVGGIEQAYADKFEVEMQEMAIRLHQASAEVERLQAQLAQEAQLRSVTEHALVQHKASWDHFSQRSAEARCHCDWLLRSLYRLKACQAETWRRQFSIRGEDPPSSGNHELDAIANRLRTQIVSLGDLDLWQTAQTTLMDMLNSAVAVTDGLDRAFRAGRGGGQSAEDEVL